MLAFVVLLGAALLLASSRRRKPIDENANERIATTLLFGMAFGFDWFTFGQATIWPVVSLLATAVGIGWLLVWSSPRLRRTRFTISYVIHCPPNIVFPFISDQRNLPRWWSEYRSVEMLTPEPVGSGSRFRSHTLIPPDGKEFVGESEILEFEPNRRMTSHATSVSRPNQGEYTFDPFEAGTRVVYRFDLEHSYSNAALGVTLIRFASTRLLRTSHERAQARIKQILEA
ncbi:MAG TPA: SRPBCC family protein [Candidatus Dormibacteraeota bacterium]|nr:SRPBCC family protein [Candidatus Dormibacteraeota bacterium]